MFTETVGKLAAKEIDLDALWRKKAVDLAAAERAAGGACLTDGGGPVDGAVRIRMEIQSIAGAIGAVRAQRALTITATFRSQAQDARTMAAQKKAELGSLVEKSSELCDQLACLEGVASGRSVQFLPSAGELRSSLLIREIAELDRLARGLDVARLSERGIFDSGGGAVLANDEIVMAVLSDTSAVPTCAALRQWLAEVAADAATRNKLDGFEQRPRRVRIAWRNGDIDREASYVFTASLAGPRDRRDDARGIDTESGMFRALPPRVASRAAAQL